MNGWIESLENSAIKSVRYRDDRERSKIREPEERAEFDREIKTMVETPAPEREEQRRSDT
ncbi:MAG: hypothetical protein HS105_03105 [Chloracidobacterium sp.]|nr:hypothetical protein [Chloracidobacterium sp.]